MVKKYLMLFILFILFGCQQEKHEWNPVFEETNFDYFNSQIEQSLSLMDEAYSETEKNRDDFIREKILQAQNRLLKIKDYYIPLTTVRQKIYDAERYFKLKNIEKSEKLLNESKLIITALDSTTKNKVFDKVILDLTSMINGVITTCNEGSPIDTYDKMKALGERVNLMLIKGDLVLSGIEFQK